MISAKAIRTKMRSRQDPTLREVSIIERKIIDYADAGLSEVSVHLDSSSVNVDVISEILKVSGYGIVITELRGNEVRITIDWSEK